MTICSNAIEVKLQQAKARTSDVHGMTFPLFGCKEFWPKMSNRRPKGFSKALTAYQTTLYESIMQAVEDKGSTL